MASGQDASGTVVTNVRRNVEKDYNMGDEQRKQPKTRSTEVQLQPILRPRTYCGQYTKRMRSIQESTAVTTNKKKVEEGRGGKTERRAERK